MSVVASVKVYDGVVLGAESMTQLYMNVDGQQQWVKSYENAQKIFQLGDLPVGVLTYGAGNIGKRSVESFVREFSRSQPAEATAPTDVDQISRNFHAFMRQQHTGAFGEMAPEQQPMMGFMVAGYSTNEHLASEWEFILPKDPEPKRVRPVDEIGASWRGVHVPFSRLMFGIDPTYETSLLQVGATAEEIQRLTNIVQSGTTRIAFDGMPLQGAIGCCRFIIQTTIGWCTYALGAPLCGGPIKLATITPGGFEWITRPKSHIEGDHYAASHSH
ncbi:MAG: hypothetical protein WCA10_19775 [Terracidiphilus sp.]